MRAAEDRVPPSVVTRAPRGRWLLERAPVRADEHPGDRTRHELHLEIANLNGRVVRSPRVVAEHTRFLRQHLRRLIELNAIPQALLAQALGRRAQPSISAAIH